MSRGSRSTMMYAATCAGAAFQRRDDNMKIAREKRDDAASHLWSVGHHVDMARLAHRHGMWMLLLALRLESGEQQACRIAILGVAA